MTEATANILVVDDDDGGRYLKAHVLRKHGYHVAEAATGMAAIEQCCAAPPDLVLLDVMLPDINGVEVSRRIKAAHPGIVVLQTSAAVTSSHDRAFALDGGADGFLVEPIEPEELLATARSLLRMRGAEQALRRLNESLELLVAERTRELTEANRRLEIESRRTPQDRRGAVAHAEAGGGRPAHRRHRPRLQQSARGHRRQHGDDPRGLRIGTAICRARRSCDC